MGESEQKGHIAPQAPQFPSPPVKQSPKPEGKPISLASPAILISFRFPGSVINHNVNEMQKMVLIVSSDKITSIDAISDIGYRFSQNLMLALRDNSIIKAIDLSIGENSDVKSNYLRYVLSYILSLQKSRKVDQNLNYFDDVMGLIDRYHTL